MYNSVLDVCMNSGDAEQGEAIFQDWGGSSSRARPVARHDLQDTGVFWMWLKIKQLGLRKFWSMLPLTRVRSIWLLVF